MTDTAMTATTRMLGYCTNVHAGVHLEQITGNLRDHAAEVRRRVAPDEPLSIGLWLPEPVTHELVGADDVRAFRRTLDELGLVPFTLNGFPYGNFHDTVVKLGVYQPDWRSPQRAAYTRDLATILSRLLEPGSEGSISTLPLGWSASWPQEGYGEAVARLHEVLLHLEQLERDTGTLIHLDLEPEPGCVLSTSTDLVAFVHDHCDPVMPRELRQRYLRVCHDVCHAAVMFEAQADALQRYADAGIAIGKVQVSSAVSMRLQELDLVARVEALRQLAAMSEDRYMHQTVIGRGDRMVFFDDLPAALADLDGDPPGEEWRVHFHVPIDVLRFGRLATTRDAIESCLACLGDNPMRHFEVETYAWDVLPPDLSSDSLAEGIARELQWLRGIAGDGYFA